MKFRFALVIVLFASLLLFANTNVAQAQWSAINSGPNHPGYAVTTDAHGEQVPEGATVTAWAGTTDDSVDEVIFTWLDPDKNPEVTDDIMVGWFEAPSVPDDVPDEIWNWAHKPQNDGILVLYFNATNIADKEGSWTVKAQFHDSVSASGKFKATSLFAVDEVPLGTIVVLLIPFGFLGFYAIKRKRNLSIDTA